MSRNMKEWIRAFVMIGGAYALLIFFTRFF